MLHLAALLGIHFPDVGFFHWFQGLWWPEANRGYAFTSSVGSDLGEVTLLIGVIALLRHHNCHAHGCWRLGKHPVARTPYVTCRKHHPRVPDKPTAEHIAEVYSAHLKESP